MKLGTHIMARVARFRSGLGICGVYDRQQQCFFYTGGVSDGGVQCPLLGSSSR